MSNVKAGLMAIAIGILVMVFRKHFRHGGPAGLRPLTDKEPTHPVEQLIVAGIGVVFIGSGILLLLEP